ncbi:MAG: hypothetical protein ACJAYU_004937 [Bradymonadia bacterium]|jgi:hypothetical protein
MFGHVVGVDLLVGGGFISAASPLPLVFSESRGVEGFAGEFRVRVDTLQGPSTITLTSEHYARLGGPYDLRNAYGAAIAGAPILAAPEERAMVADASVNLSHGYFPNPLNVVDSPGAVGVFLVMLVLGSLSLAAGYRPPWIPILLWFGWACLLNRDVFIRNPSMPYIGWILLATALVPRGEA